ncbi:MAG: mechanosensitive ion channel [candidate division Zixibacteria bacterium]|nr:mechanosensitive ion channel [candidate division Zixibacteria bacterium]
MNLVKVQLENLGMSGGNADTLCKIISAVIILIMAYLSYMITKRIILKIVKVVAEKSKATWDDILLKRRVFHRLAQLVPALIIYIVAPLFPWAQMWIQRLCISYMIIIGLLAIDALLNTIVDIYRTYEISKQRPIKGYVQVIKIFLYVISVIFIISTLMERSPWGLLSGLGALTAVLMLVFKDSILGLVASIQLSSNNMVRIGDWIEMSKYGADGDVIDVSLNTVKVQNWDKTITTIPTYALMSDSFKNWRGMTESGGRRIKRAVNIDMNSIKFCTSEMLDRFEKFQLLCDYIKQKRVEIAEYNKEQNIDTSELINGRNLTNIGCFRAYLAAYLRNHPLIHNDMTFLVRHLSPTQNGLPVQVYVFSTDYEWANYEAIQADILDHILAVVPEFELRVFQNPSGSDFRQLAGAARQE